ncbi:MAG TPA: VOC family protein [Burkholderiales bacterium]|nr:VOC family protein [Burkholderiales bacterium]
MFAHIGLRVRDLDKAARLYEAMLAPLGHVPGARDQTYAGFGPEGRPALWLHLSKEQAGSHVALRAPTREAVDRFFAEGKKAGARDNGKPGLRPDYAPNYYAAFLVDLDGNNVEAVCMT